ncbi:MDR family MFS transporter [Listeria sp. PSOL-1]|uniref:MDR family MFS transporter n=1 Tax=Listeria sp. PSOL-1 TaxID=1844999 RepID=UPI0013D49896|nr:MDR family MFS transporter [Listeria sp. PSOL-1]
MDTTDFELKKVIPSVLTIALGMLLVMMDTTIMNVALPRIQSAFHSTLATSQWTITAYTLAMATVIPYAGFLADRFSVKRVFGVAILFFTIASFFAGVSTSLTQLIIFRILQGVFGGVVGPLGIAISFRIIPMEKRGSMMGFLGLPMLIAPIVGPAFSGWLIANFSWHTIFMINIPIGMIALLMVRFLLPRFKANHSAKIDIKGAIFSPFAFPFLIYGIHLGTDHGFTSTSTLLFLLIGLVMLTIFIMIEWFAEFPLLHIKAFKISEFRKGIVLMWLNQIAVFGSMLLIPLYLQNICGYSSFQAGLMMVPQAIAGFIGMIVGGRIYDQYGAKFAALPGFLMTGISLGLLAQLQATSAPFYLFIAVIFLGLGQGLVNMQINNHALQSVPMKFISRVTPLSNEMLQVVNSLSVAFLTAFLTKQISSAKMVSLKGASILGYHHTFLLLMAFIMMGIMLTCFLKTKQSLVNKA